MSDPTSHALNSMQRTGYYMLDALLKEKVVAFCRNQLGNRETSFLLEQIRTYFIWRMLQVSFQSDKLLQEDSSDPELPSLSEDMSRLLLGWRLTGQAKGLFLGLNRLNQNERHDLCNIWANDENGECLRKYYSKEVGDDEKNVSNGSQRVCASLRY